VRSFFWLRHAILSYQSLDLAVEEYLVHLADLGCINSPNPVAKIKIRLTSMRRKTK